MEEGGGEDMLVRPTNLLIILYIGACMNTNLLLWGIGAFIYQNYSIIVFFNNLSHITPVQFYYNSSRDLCSHLFLGNKVGIKSRKGEYNNTF